MDASHELRSRLAHQIGAIPVVDVHTHLRTAKPHADHLADVVLYHHLGTELISAGLPPDAIWRDEMPHEVVDPGIDPRERVRRARPYLQRIRNTTIGGFLRTILRDLYGVPDGELTEDNLDEVGDRVATSASDPQWAEFVLRERCGIAHSATVEHVGTAPRRPGFSFMSEALGAFCLRHKGLDLHHAVAQLERHVGVEIVDGEMLRAAVEGVLRRDRDAGVLAANVWLPADFLWRKANASALRRAIERLRTRDAEPADRDAFLTAALQYALNAMRETGPRIMQVFMGAEVKLPHRSISVGSGQFGRELCHMVGAYPEIRFELTTASHVHGQDVCIIAKHFPNVGVAGYWWHLLYPRYMHEAIECRFDVVPSNKITAFFSDAYHAEWCYPKAKLVRRLLTEVLYHKVMVGDYTEEYAVALARQVLFDNPRERFGIAAGAAP